jgi:hypothetical protein
LNRWNRKWYTVLEVTSKEVTLQREDGTQFTIAKSELYANYANIQGNPESNILEK